ncbi:MAG TPA: Fic family protein [Methanocorpusculum sp.]|nr:Fic family protein [Methanocorpusculum sp.]
MTHTIWYRIEARKKKNSQNRYYYLIREFRTDGKKCVIARYIKSGSHLSEEEITEYLAENIFRIEDAAQKKYLSARQNAVTTEYLDAAAAESIERLRYLHNYVNNLISTDEVQYYEQEAEYQYIHGTTAIEGNTLTYGETKELLEHGILPNGKSAREIFEIQNFKAVAAYRNKHTGKVTLSFIRRLHKLIMTNILSDPGNFRTTDNILISGYDYQVTPSLLIEEELENLIAWYYQKISDGYNPFECAVIFHYRFETIHPFIDGNGRVGRELLNYLLIKTGYPRMLVPGNKRGKYLSALHCANNDDVISMMKIFAEIIIEQRISALEENFRQQLEIRISGSYKNSAQHNLSEFFLTEK